MAPAGPPIWLLVRRSLEATPEIKYYVSNGEPRRRWEYWRRSPARGTRSRQYLEDAKSYLGMAQYETRSWIGWHHHMM